MRQVLIGLTLLLFFVALADAVNSLPEDSGGQGVDKTHLVKLD